MQHLPSFLSVAEADTLFAWCLRSPDVGWQQETFAIYGRSVTAPRRLCWFGDTGINYRYTGLDHRACGWPEPLRVIREKLARQSGTRFNFVLLNRYDHGQQYMGWHRDDEAAAAPVIASLSVGAERRFRYRDGPGHTSKGIDLAHGSLLIFDGRTQHMLTKTKREVSTRVNLTFRQVAVCS